MSQFSLNKTDWFLIKALNKLIKKSTKALSETKSNHPLKPKRKDSRGKTCVTGKD